MTLPELMAKLEAATEGSDALDREIAKVYKIEWSSDEEGNYSPYDITPRRIRFTRSLDAALTLLAKGTLWAAISMEDGPIARLCWPQPDGGYIGGYHEARANTVPLAMCAAALKARL